MNKLYFLGLVVLGLSSLQAKENVKNLSHQSTVNVDKVLSSNCVVGTSQILLDINNVSTTILNGGDMWWNLSNGSYEVPKGSGLHSIFAGSLWLGGVDDNGQLKVAAQTYRQSGTDFWPGPLDNVRLTSSGAPNSNYGTTNASICSQYNQHYIVTKSEVEEFIAYSNSSNQEVEFPDYEIPQSIISYPGNRTTDDNSNAYEGEDNQVQTSAYYALEQLAPYRDVNGDGYYNPYQGDYPEFNLDNSLDCQEADMLFGDQTIWYVFNDNGNMHTATGAVESIGIEIHAQAFAFSTDDEINNMTFNDFKLINRSHDGLYDTYFGIWVDPDLGNYTDDYVGCDVVRGLGYCYNGDIEDEGVAGYGVKLPAVGIDFFRGPLADQDDGIDNDLDGEVDEDGEQIIMSKFVYFNNDGTLSGNPSTASDYYNYLRGHWLDNLPMTYGGNGRDQSNPECNYMFPGDTDPNFEENWTEQTAGNYPSDRRFIQSAGPFTLEPGAVNRVTSGVVWARESSENPFNAVELLRITDDLAQDLFESCFEVENVTSVDEHADLDFDLYPNPSVDYIHIQMPEKITKLRIYDITGKVVKLNSVQEGRSAVDVNVRSLNAGQYICEITTETGQYSKSFIKR